MFVVIGSVTADLFIFSEELPALAGADGFQAGNLVFTDRPLSILLGGNGGISACVAARLGLHTALCGAVGDDPLGRLLVEWLAGQGVDLSGLARSQSQATSSSTIISAGPASQAVYHHLGASAEFDFEQLPADLFSRAGVLLGSSYPLLARLRAGGFARALAATHEAGGVTGLDVGPAVGQPVTLAELRPLLPYVDYLLGNAHELTTLTGQAAWETAAAELLAAGASRVVIKRGAAGASLRAAGIQVDLPAFQVDGTISAGAGDSFNVGLLAGVRQGRPLVEALRLASAVAALVVTTDRGALDSPTLAEVETFLAEH